MNINDLFKLAHSTFSPAPLHEQDRDKTINDVLGSLDTSSYMSVRYTEEGTKMFTCQICGKEFGMSSHMKTHLENVHLSAGQVQCGICHKKFKNKESLKTHFRNIHGLAKDQAY